MEPPLNIIPRGQLIAEKSQLESDLNQLSRPARQEDALGYRARTSKLATMQRRVTAINTELARRRAADEGQEKDGCTLLLLQHASDAPYYYATREDVPALLVEWLVAMDQDAPVMLSRLALNGHQAAELPAWVWQTLDERDKS